MTARAAPAPKTIVWLGPTETRYSCLCEACLDDIHASGEAFLDTIRTANVHGALPLESEVGFVRCRSGHELVVRRLDRPPSLVRPSSRQLALV